jgi:hypothetical protein
VVATAVVWCTVAAVITLAHSAERGARDFRVKFRVSSFDLAGSPTGQFVTAEIVGSRLVVLKLLTGALLELSVVGPTDRSARLRCHARPGCRT